MLLLQHLQPQEFDLLLVPRQAEVVQGRVSLQRCLRRQLFFLQPEGESAPRAAHVTLFVRAPLRVSGHEVWARGGGRPPLSLSLLSCEMGVPGTTLGNEPQGIP